MEALTRHEKTLTAFALFSMAMRMGPTSFGLITQIAMKIEIIEEFQDQAKGWIRFSDNRQTTNNAQPQNDEKREGT